MFFYPWEWKMRRTWSFVYEGWKRRLVKDNFRLSHLCSPPALDDRQPSPQLPALYPYWHFFLLCNLCQILLLLTLYACPIVNTFASLPYFRCSLHLPSLTEWQKVREQRCHWKSLTHIFLSCHGLFWCQYVQRVPVRHQRRWMWVY